MAVLYEAKEGHRFTSSVRGHITPTLYQMLLCRKGLCVQHSFSAFSLTKYPSSTEHDKSYDCQHIFGTPLVAYGERGVGGN